ncbi:MAG TPA: response regulator [Anaerolineales bacterium]
MPAGDKVRVLIVDDVADTRENVRRLLQFESDIEVIGAARTAQEGIQLTSELDPDVILMDINMPDMDGIAATEAIRQRSPLSQVVILSVQGDPNYMRRAMLAGARDFLTKPPMGDDLISAVRRSGEMSRSERAKAKPSRPAAAGSVAGIAAAGASLGLVQGKVVTVYSPKGGTGCTTIAANLAIALHNEDTRVVLLDANLQFGDVAMFFNEQGKNTILDIAPRVEELDVDILEEIMIKHEASGVHILAAPQRPEQAEKISVDQFTKVLDFLRRVYSYVVIDTSSMLTDPVLAAIDHSDAIVLVTTQEIPAIKNARLFLDLLQTMGVDRSHLVFVMNKFDRRIGITPDRVAENLHEKISAVIPLDERVVIPAVNKGIPFMVDNRTQPVARGVLAVAEAVRAQLASLEAAEMPMGRR